MRGLPILCSLILLSRYVSDYAIISVPCSMNTYVNQLVSHICRSVQFERAYCEYRLNRTHEALATLRSVTNHDVRTKELLAQVVCVVTKKIGCNECVSGCIHVLLLKRQCAMNV